MSAVAICFFATGVGALAAKGCGATWHQGLTFASADIATCICLNTIFRPYFNEESALQQVVFELTGRITCYLSGMQATRLTCEKPIQWGPAIIAQLASNYSANLLISLKSFKL